MTYDWIRFIHLEDIDRRTLMVFGYILGIKKYSTKNKLDLTIEILNIQNEDNKFIYCSKDFNLVWINQNVQFWSYINDESGI